MIKVMVVDEQTLFREGIKAILKQTNAYEVIASLASAKEAMDFFRREETLPDVVLMNLQLSQKDAIQKIRWMKDSYPSVRFITLMEQMDEEAVIDALMAGADGFLLKKHYAENLMHAICSVHDGDTIISGTIARMLAKRIRMLSMDEIEYLQLCAEQNGYQFTKRELDVAYLLKENYSNQEIAKTLYLGEGTVKNYVSEIYNKLNIRVRTDVIKLLQDLVAQVKR